MQYKTWKNWSAEVWAWTTQEPNAFWGIVIIAESTLICFWLAPTETWILVWGLILQILGIAVAIQNLLKIRITCNQVSLKKRFMDWVDAFPPLKIKPVEAHVEIVSPRSQIAAQCDLLYGYEGGPSIEEKLEHLQNQIDHLLGESYKREREVQLLTDELHVVKKIEEKARRTMKTEIRHEIEHLFTQDIIGSLVGFVLVMYGLILSTLADSIFKL